MTLPGRNAPAPVRRAPKYTGPERRQIKRWRPRPLRGLLALLAVAAVGYGVAVVWLITQETRLVFQAGRSLAIGRPPFPYEQIDLPRADGARQFAWVMRRGGSDAGPWVLYLHGNAATIASKVNISHYAELRALGLNVLAPEYRGYAGLDGQPSEAALEIDARAGYDYLRVTRNIAPARLVIYGWSLGGAVAVNLAAQTEQAAVILEGAPAALVDIGQQRYPFFPIRLIMRNPFNSIGKIERIRSPILFLHGADDAVIPIAEGRRLFEAARGEKTFVEIRGGHVSASEADTERFYGSIRQFLKEHGRLRLAPAENGEGQ
jgi:dipeptidyl aminopeptidase/acylaminoacyl peptidase